MSTDPSYVEVLVCTTCRFWAKPPARLRSAAPEPRAGARLYAALQANPPAGARIVPVQCLANCSLGCTIALRGPGRWSYIYGRIDADADLCSIREGILRYAAAPDGIVPWRERPDHFRKNCIARLPPLEVAP